jgi:hypothetical protein
VNLEEGGDWSHPCMRGEKGRVGKGQFQQGEKVLHWHGKLSK